MSPPCSRRQRCRVVSVLPSARRVVLCALISLSSSGAFAPRGRTTARHRGAVGTIDDVPTAGTARSSHGGGGLPGGDTCDSIELGYCTDVEGNLAYFRRYVARSGVLRFDDDGASSPRLSLVHERAHFVFGGDLFDQGDGDLRLSRLLVDLKRRFPDRVTLLMGNRDLNKVNKRDRMMASCAIRSASLHHTKTSPP